MHLSALLSRLPRPKNLGWRILSATGFRATIPIFGILVVLVAVYRDGRIERFGPLMVQPTIPVILIVPLLLSIACGVAHSTWSPPVVRRGPRVHVARAASYLAAVSISVVIAGLGNLLAGEGALGGTMRNLLWMVGATIATTALIGITYAWLPVVLAVGAGILSSATDNPWTVYGLLFHPQATGGQLGFAILACVTGLALGIWDPVSRGYLRLR